MSSKHSAIAHDAASSLLAEVLDKYQHELVEFRRDLHAHPELSWQETRTTAVLAERLRAAGWAVRELDPTGLIADLGEEGRTVALRADIDALPVQDFTAEPWASTVPGVAHACGHDVHTAALLGAALALTEVHRRGLLTGRVRLLFQPAEEVMPGGALTAIGQGVLKGVDRIYMLHCDPTLDVGQVGLREGPITGAADKIEVVVRGRGGHTSRPHLTQDLTYALAKVVTDLPAALSRRLDPRAGASLVWGLVEAGSAANVIPAEGRCAGTLRTLDPVAWNAAGGLVSDLVESLVAPYDVKAELIHTRGVPPVVNPPAATNLLGLAVTTSGAALVSTAQSLGGEDFGWYLEQIPGAMARLGTRTPGGPVYDLHQGDLRVDDGSVVIGAKVLAEAALTDHHA